MTATLARIVPDGVRPWLGAVCISFSAVWVRLADVEPTRSAFLRAVYALPLLAILLAVRPAPQRRWLLPLGIVSGMLLGGDFLMWHRSIEIVGAGLGTVLPNLQVVVVGVLGVVLFGERPRARFWVALPVVLTGVWLLGAVGTPLVAGSSFVAGIALGVLTAGLYAGALVVMRLARASNADLVSTLWAITLGAAIVTAPAAVVEGVAAPAGWPADGWLVVLAVGSQVVGWLLLASSIHRLPAAATSVALLLQPVLALLWGALLLAEPLGPPQVAGAAVVLTGVALAHHGTARIPVATGPATP
ncbi:MAG: DMT family transporter [Nitriliruptoraceae bacterium]